MALTHQTDYAGRSRAQYLEQYKGKPRFDAWVQSYVAEIQELEDAAWTLWVNRVLQNGLATGDLLDKLGKLVGQDRGGQLDPQYQILITARIKTNRSSGRREELITIASLLVPGTAITFREYYPAAIWIEPLGVSLLPPSIIAGQFISHAVTAGVRLLYVALVADLAHSFTLTSIHDPGFAAGPPPSPSVATQGLGSVHSPGFSAGPAPANTGGGSLASVFQY